VGVTVKWMTERGAPTAGLTVRPGTLAGAVVVVGVVAVVGLVVVGVVAVVGAVLVAVGGPPPGALVELLVVLELCAQPARASVAVTPTTIAATTARPSPRRLIDSPPRSVGAVHK
jgi:hypothetical protein